MIETRDGAPSAEDDAPSCPESEASTAYVTIHNGDALDELRKIPDASIDAIVTDPPYELGFMGKRWDASGIAYSVELWRECLRVLKPGGHLASFGGTRTYHRMTCAIEDAGFEIRDGLTWLYGSGFPKSLDVSKAIDKAGGDPLAFRRFAQAYATAVEASTHKHIDIDRHLGIKSSSCYWAREDHRGGLPPRHHWERVRDLLDLDASFERLYDEAEREVIGERTTGRGTGKGAVAYIGDSDNRDVTAPATPAAEQWQGWGTALKPAQEPIVLARKPLAGTVAANVLAHGTGALNIDGTRVAHVTVNGGNLADNPHLRATINGGNGGHIIRSEDARRVVTPNAAGRWPSNVLLSHSPDCGDVCQPGCPVAELDAQSGTLRNGGSNATAAGGVNGGVYEGGFQRAASARAGDSGGASRFFPAFRYQAKAPTRERPKVDGVAHPTVKPLELMRWLVRLVAPPGGVVLDPFAGSGTTLQAAREEGFASIGIEREPTYLPLIAARLGIEIEPTWPEPEPAPVYDPILVAIEAAPDRAALVAIWKANKSAWTGEHTRAAEMRRDALADGEAVA